MRNPIRRLSRGNPITLFLLFTAVAVSHWDLAIQAQNPVLFYSNNFEAGAGPEWSIQRTGTTPVGIQQFLGVFGNETNRLLLTNLPAHTNIHIYFDLFILGDWRGYGTGNGAHRWNCGVVGMSKPLLATSFSGEIERRQSFPGAHPSGDNYFA